jgi:hypothetical protein
MLMSATHETIVGGNPAAGAARHGKLAEPSSAFQPSLTAEMRLI